MDALATTSAFLELLQELRDDIIERVIISEGPYRISNEHPEEHGRRILMTSGLLVTCKQLQAEYTGPFERVVLLGENTATISASCMTLDKMRHLFIFVNSLSTEELAAVNSMSKLQVKTRAYGWRELSSVSDEDGLATRWRGFSLGTLFSECRRSGIRSRYVSVELSSDMYWPTHELPRWNEAEIRELGALIRRATATQQASLCKAVLESLLSDRMDNVQRIRDQHPEQRTRLANLEQQLRIAKAQPVGERISWTERVRTAYEAQNVRREIEAFLSPWTDGAKIVQDQLDRIAATDGSLET